MFEVAFVLDILCQDPGHKVLYRVAIIYTLSIQVIYLRILWDELTVYICRGFFIIVLGIFFPIIILIILLQELQVQN